MKNIGLFEETKTVVLKTNNICNLNCSYCYDDDNRSRSSTKLGIHEIPSIFEELVSFSKKREINSLNIIWHGGEPMLMGLDYYSLIVNIQRELDFKFNNLIQTNGVYLNEKWIAFFKKNKFKIGVSFDGSESANKVHRQMTDQVINNIHLLNNHSISPSLICVISDLNYVYHKEMFDFLSTVETEYVDLVPCYENNTKHSLSVQHYIDFMIGMFDLWWNSDKKINFRGFNNIIDIMSGNITKGKYITCSLSGRCGEIISINSDGKIYFCDCLPKNETYYIGNIENGFEYLLKGQNYISLKKENEHTESDCKNCKYLQACGKGCLNRRLNSGNNLKDYYCEARQTFFSHIMKTLGINEIVGASYRGTPAFTRGPQPFEHLN